MKIEGHYYSSILKKLELEWKIAKLEVSIHMNSTATKNDNSMGHLQILEEVHGVLFSSLKGK